jgi:RNA polymerase sigma factor (sigma-70 family)
MCIGSAFSKPSKSDSETARRVQTGVGLQICEKESLQDQQSRTLGYFARQPCASEAALEADQARSLVQDFADGDCDAFWKLWVLYKSHLYHLCLWQMDGIREDAEDALSRVMLKAHEKLPCNAHQIRNVRAWLSKLTLNLCIDVHRERKRQYRRVESIDDARTAAVDLIRASSYSPEEWFLTQEVFSDVCNAIDDLPTRLREPFVLRFFQELSYDDIADKLTLSAENVRKRIQQARDILKDRLRRDCSARQSSSWRSVGGIGTKVTAGNRNQTMKHAPSARTRIPRQLQAPVIPAD